MAPEVAALWFVGYVVSSLINMFALWHWAPRFTNLRMWLFLVCILVPPLTVSWVWLCYYYRCGGPRYECGGLYSADGQTKAKGSSDRG